MGPPVSPQQNGEGKQSSVGHGDPLDLHFILGKLNRGPLVFKIRALFKSTVKMKTRTSVRGASVETITRHKSSVNNQTHQLGRCIVSSP